MTRILAIMALLSTGACATTNPGSGARMTYHLPRTDAAVAMDLTLTSCGPVTVEADVKVLPVAGAQDKLYEVRGSDLASSHVSREFGLTVNQQGVIQGVNTSNEDQTPAIIGNIIKTAATIVPLLAGTRSSASETPPLLTCKPEVAAAVARRSWLVGEIKRLRGELQASNAARPDLVRLIRRLAKEQGDLESTILHSITFSAKPIQLEPGQSAGTVAFDYGDAAKWFVIGDEQQASKSLDRMFGMDWKQEVLAASAGSPQPVPARDRSLGRCRFAIAVPAVERVKVSLIRVGETLPPDTKAANVIPAAQFADPASLCLSVGFGEGRSVKLDFDEYGRTTAFAWTSSARAATVSGAISGYASDLGTIYGALESPERTDKQKAEIERLETQQRLNELRRCQAIIEAGGYDCKAAEDGADE